MGGRTQPRKDRIEPLWDRIDSSRVKIVLFLTLFIGAGALAWAVVVALLAAAVVVLAGSQAQPYVYAYAFVAGLLLGGGLATVHAVRNLTGTRSLLPRRLGAVPVAPDALLAVRSTLQDMAIAAGFGYTPSLWIIEGSTRINAFAVGTSEQDAVVGITRGFADRLSADAQRAVFANLMARLRNGNTAWATVVTAVIGPMWAVRDAQYRAQDEGDSDVVVDRIALPLLKLSGQFATLIFNGVWFVLLAIVVSEMLMAGHERSARAASEKADAEGMLLLKDPQSMLWGLVQVLEAMNTVPQAGEAYSMLFYCWAGEGYAPEDDPEMRRIGRLREVLGTEGLMGLRPPVGAPVARWR